MKYQIHISASKNKKYYALLENGKKIHFGDSRYQQYEDKTPQKKYKHLNHKDDKRRELYCHKVTTVGHWVQVSDEGQAGRTGWLVHEGSSRLVGQDGRTESVWSTLGLK